MQSWQLVHVTWTEMTAGAATLHIVLTCKLVPYALARSKTKGHVCQTPALVPPCLVPHPPLRFEGLSILPPPLITVHGVQTHMHYGAFWNSIRPNLQCNQHRQVSMHMSILITL